MKYFFYFILLLGIGSCQSDSIVRREEIAREKKEPLANDKIETLIEQLASPKFFEYTQAARELIKLGKEALPYLTKEIKTVREANESILPVCLVLIKIIFQQQDLQWVASQTQNPSEKIRQIAEEELTRRNEAKATEEEN